jgi:hypothetical protein
MNADTGFRSETAEMLPSDLRSYQRAITAMVLGCGRGEDPGQILKSAWPDDRRAQVFLRASSDPPLMTTAFPLQNIVGMYRSIAPKSIALRLFGHGVSVDLTGLGTVTIPAATNAPLLPFVAEGAPGPVVMLPDATFTVGPVRKILVLASVTRELDQASPQGAVNIISTILADAVAKSLDAIAFGAAAGSATAPPGLLYNVTPLTASALTDPFDAVAEDLGALAAAIGNAGVDTNDIVFVAGPKQATVIKFFAGALFDAPVYSSIALAGKVAAFAGPALAAAYADLPQIETTREAAMHYEDTTPLNIGTPGTPPTVAAPTYSAFQKELIAIRVRGRAAWGVHPGGAAVVAVSW